MPVTESTSANKTQIVGRYALYDAIASGGMATVHLARLLGPVGFSRTVAIKRLHPHYASDPEFVSMFLDEARLAARIRHPNVVQTLDVVAQDGDLFLVMDFVQGESLARLLRAARSRKERIPPKIAATIIAGALHGLHAAHEAKNERGEPLGIVHRDVSPQNVLVGTDGVARVLDFGVAKAAGRVHETQAGQIKGKLAYMAPEQLQGNTSRATDIYAISIVFWEALTGERLFAAEDPGEQLAKIIERKIVPPSRFVPELGTDVDALVMRGLDPAPQARFATAREMARAVERLIGVVPPAELGEWVESMVPEILADRLKRVVDIESSANLVPVPHDPAGHVIEMRDGGVTVHSSVVPPTAITLGSAMNATSVTSDASAPDPAVGVAGQRQMFHGNRAALSRRAMLVAGSAIAAALVLIALLWPRQSTTQAPIAAPSEATKTDTRAGAPVAPTAVNLPEGRASADLTPEPGAAAATSLPLAKAPRESGASTAAKPAQTATKAKPSSKRAVDCSLPFTIDAQGIRRPKAECL